LDTDVTDISETMHRIQQDDEVKQLRMRLSMLRNALVELDILMADGDDEAVREKLHELLGDEATC
jgi:hypothetical protein